MLNCSDREESRFNLGARGYRNRARPVVRVAVLFAMHMSVEYGSMRDGSGPSVPRLIDNNIIDLTLVLIGWVGGQRKPKDHRVCGFRCLRTALDCSTMRVKFVRTSEAQRL